MLIEFQTICIPGSMRTCISCQSHPHSRLGTSSFSVRMCITSEDESQTGINIFTEKGDVIHPEYASLGRFFIKLLHPVRCMVK